MTLLIPTTQRYEMNMFQEHQTIKDYWTRLGSPQSAHIVLDDGRAVIGVISSGNNESIILGVHLWSHANGSRFVLVNRLLLNDYFCSSSVIEIDPDATIAEVRRLANAVNLLLSEPFHAASILNNTLNRITESTKTIDEPPPTVRNLEPCHAETT